jgi:hypothetical protein
MTAPKCANTWLSDYAPFVTFQAGEDGILPFEKVQSMSFQCLNLWRKIIADRFVF